MQGGIVGGIHRHYPAHCGGGLSVTKGPPTGWCSASALRDIEKHHHRKPTHNPRVAVVSHRYELQMVMVGQQELARVMDLGAVLGIKVEPALEVLKVVVHI
ncbi:hypothetical protein D3C76_696820 [compost metagenome]